MLKHFRYEAYTKQVSRWPENGRFILAQYDEDSIIVYQAYNAEIAAFAIENQRFGGAFNFFPDELDQAEFFVDDVSDQLGHESESRASARNCARPSRL